MLSDVGSDISLINDEMARKLGLKGKETNLIKVGDVNENCVRKEYCLCLADKLGRY